MSEPRDPGEEQVGSVAEEAAKLVGALSEWARDHGSDLGEGLSGLVDHAAASAREVNEHLATGAAECTWCPLCRTVHAVLMFVADAGFVATALLAPDGPPAPVPIDPPRPHRTVAFASMSAALVSYAIMLPFFRKE